MGSLNHGRSRTTQKNTHDYVERSLAVSARFQSSNTKVDLRRSTWARIQCITLSNPAAVAYKEFAKEVLELAVNRLSNQLMRNSRH